MRKLETKTSADLQKMFAEKSGLIPSLITVIKIGDEGDFNAVVIGGNAVVRGGAEQSNIETIRDHLRLKYRLTD